MKTASKGTPSTITVHVSMRFTSRSNSKRIVFDANGTPSRLRPESALIKAVARAYRWRKQIEEGEYGSITELAKAKKVNQSYACRMLRLTLLGPNIVVAILNGSIDPAPAINELMKPFPIGWLEQEQKFRVVL